MILRRLATAIRRQDWFTVVVEFVIVVAGIFVGLQVTDWNEQRQLRERELNYLVRLSEDVAVMRAEIAEIQARAEGRPEIALRAFRALEACDSALAEPEDFRLTFAFYQNQRTAVLVERTYEEMVASGALAAMADQELSSAIAGTFSELSNYKDFVTGVRVSLPVIDQVLWRRLDLFYDEQGVPTLGNFDFDAALRRALAVGFAAAYGLPGAVRILTDNRGFEPLLDEGKNAAIDNALGHHGHQFGVRDAVEVLRQVGVYDLGVAVPKRAGDVVHGIVRRSPGPESIRVRTEIGFEDRLDGELHRHLHNPVAEGRDPQRTQTSIRLGNQNAPYRLGSIGLLFQITG